VINPRRIRHGHMVNINKQIMLEGMRADFVAVDRLSQKLIENAAARNASPAAPPPAPISSPSSSRS